MAGENNQVYDLESASMVEYVVYRSAVVTADVAVGFVHYHQDNSSKSVVVWKADNLSSCFFEAEETIVAGLEPDVEAAIVKVMESVEVVDVNLVLMVVEVLIVSESVSMVVTCLETIELVSLSETFGLEGGGIPYLDLSSKSDRDIPLITKGTGGRSGPNIKHLSNKPLYYHRSFIHSVIHWNCHVGCDREQND
ncbi:unnamed protein product [Peronospora belbahrii]|uniref:Uncharacterized protein n=1 Tax=Peronospora belbahrii TaxID=622444 RepID=A0ABN8CMW6_9STRA|nr:unnamed protein product [Peronospora belbahrii]